MHCIYCFSNESGSIEFVVISDVSKREVLEDYESKLRGIALSAKPLLIDGDATSFPCDRALIKE